MSAEMAENAESGDTYRCVDCGSEWSTQRATVAQCIARGHHVQVRARTLAGSGYMRDRPPRVPSYPASSRAVDRPRREICGLSGDYGAYREPLACAYPKGHAGPHAWASLPTFVDGKPVSS